MHYSIIGQPSGILIGNLGHRYNIGTQRLLGKELRTYALETLGATVGATDHTRDPMGDHFSFLSSTTIQAHIVSQHRQASQRRQRNVGLSIITDCWCAGLAQQVLPQSRLNPLFPSSTQRRNGSALSNKILTPKGFRNPGIRRISLPVFVGTEVYHREERRRLVEAGALRAFRRRRRLRRSNIKESDGFRCIGSEFRRGFRRGSPDSSRWTALD